MSDEETKADSPKVKDIAKAASLLDKINSKRWKILPPIAGDTTPIKKEFEKTISLKSIQLGNGSSTPDRARSKSSWTRKKNKVEHKVESRESSPEAPPTPISCGYVSPWDDTASEDEDNVSKPRLDDDKDECDWQEGKTLRDTNLHMLKYGVGSDLIILLNKTQQPLLAHSYILASRSGQLAIPLNKQKHKKMKILRIHDIDTPIFLQLLRYIYTNEYEFTSLDQVSRLLPIVKRCGPTNHMDDIFEYMMSILDNENVCTISELAHTYDNKRLASLCVHYVIYNAQKTLPHPSFGDFCRSCVERIVRSDEIQADELTIYYAVQLWAERECDRQQLECTEQNLRQVLGPVLYLVRFPLIDKLSIGRDMSVFKVLTADEKLSLYQYYNGRVAALHRTFSTKQRTHHHLNKLQLQPDSAQSSNSHHYTRSSRVTSRSTLASSRKCLSKRSHCSTASTPMSELSNTTETVVNTVCRYKSVTGPWTIKESDVVSFKCSAAIILKGIQMFGLYGSAEEFQITVTVMKNDVQIYSEDTTHYADDVKPADVMFDQPIIICGETLHSIQVTMADKETYIGVDGARNVAVDGVNFKFIDNGNDITRGQIPGILFSKSLNEYVVYQDM